MFVHDGSETTTDGFDFTVSDGTTTLLLIRLVLRSTAVDDAPSLDTNAGVTVAEGSTTTITTAMLDVSDVDTTDPNLDYTLTGALI